MRAVSGEGVTRLLDGIAHFHNSHDRAGALAAIHAHYVQGSLLTAWRPPALVPGAPLIA